LRRVTNGPVVVLTWDRDVHEAQWLVADYLPSMAELDAHHPSPATIAQALGGGAVEGLPVPHDCTDGFCHAYWRPPEACPDPRVRAGISGIARLPNTTVDRAMTRLARDLQSGVWQRAHVELLDVEEIDAGYRIVTAGAAQMS